MDPLRDGCGIAFDQVWDEITETRVFPASDVRVRPVDKFNLRAASLREALDLVEHEGFAQVQCVDADKLAASGCQVWTLVFEWENKQVTWSLVKKAQGSSKTNLREGENRDVPCLSEESSTNVVFSSPQHHLTKHPLRKGMKERERVKRASRDPQVYILTPLYLKKGGGGGGGGGSGGGGEIDTIGQDTPEEGNGGTSEANMDENRGGDSQESNDVGSGHTPKQVGRGKTTKTKKKKSNFQEEDPCRRIIFPTLDRSAQVRKRIILKLCTLPTNLMITFLSLLFW